MIDDNNNDRTIASFYFIFKKIGLYRIKNEKKKDHTKLGVPIISRSKNKKKNSLLKEQIDYFFTICYYL